MPDDVYDLLGVIGGDGGTHLFALDDDLDEALLVLAAAVVGEPVVHVFGAHSPPMGHSL